MDLNEKYMLTVKEAAEYYNIGTKSLRRIVENGEKKFAVSCTNNVIIYKRGVLKNMLISVATITYQ